MMNLVENYISDVALYLPEKNRNDILEELRGLIDEQVEDISESLSRKPTIDEIAALLKQIGHPVKVARQYYPTSYLIGPVIYPVYRQVLRLSFFASFATFLGLVLISGLINGASAWSFVGALFQVFDIAVWVFAMVTGVFVVLETSGEKLSLFERWNPIKRLSQKKASTDKSDVITNLVSEGILLLWWNGRVDFSTVWPDWLRWDWVAQGTSHVESVGVVVPQLVLEWSWIYWPINVVLLAYFILHLWILICGYWQKKMLVLEFVLAVPFLIMLAWLLSLKSRFEINAVSTDNSIWLTERLDYFVISIICVVFAVTVYDLYKYWKIYRKLN